MIITWLGHSCFKLQSAGGTQVVTDPYSPQIGISLPQCSADAVTVSHQHFDHNNVNAISGAPTVIQNAGTFEVKGVKIRGVHSFHDDKGGALRGGNIIFNICVDGVNVCHLGDVGHLPTPALIKEIGQVDVLLVPVGGNYTVDACAAMKYVEALNPAVVIPMHYKTGGVNIDIADAGAFAECWGKRAVKCVSGKAEFCRDDLDGMVAPQMLLFRI